MKLSAGQLRFILNCWPPFWGAGIKVEEISKDFTFARVSMAFRWYNKNYMRVQFGGSLYSMTDPFFVLLLLKQLGQDFITWDKQGEIDYVKPGRGRVYAEFSLSKQQVAVIRSEAMSYGKTLPILTTTIYDEQQQVIATVRKTIYVKYLNKE